MLGFFMTFNKKLIAVPIKIFIKKFLILSKKFVNGFATLDTRELVSFSEPLSNFASLFFFLSTSAFFLSCSAFFASIALCSLRMPKISSTTELIDFKESKSSPFKKLKISSWTSCCFSSSWESEIAEGNNLVGSNWTEGYADCPDLLTTLSILIFLDLTLNFPLFPFILLYSSVTNSTLSVGIDCFAILPATIFSFKRVKYSS